MNKIISLLSRIYLFLFKKIYREEKYARKIGVDIGKDCRIYTDRFGSEPYLISVGNKVTLSNYVLFITHDGSPWIFGSGNDRYFKYARIKIGNNVFIGMGCTILPGIKIGNNVIVGSGSVITKNLAADSIYAGNPARKISTMNDYKNKMKSDFCHGSEYDHIKNKKERILVMEKDYFTSNRQSQWKK